MQYNYRGIYDSTQNYAVKDVVSYSDSNGLVNYYMCLTSINNSSPQAPVVGRDSTSWGIISSLSNFPNSVDTFTSHAPILSSDINDINTYQSLILKTSRTSSEDDQLNALTQKLRNKLILSDDVNAIQDSIQNLQNFFKSNVEGYINSKQTEFNSKVDAFSDKGTFNLNTQYYAKNIVTYNGTVYLCKQDSLNHAPTGLDTDLYWRVLSKQGDKGLPGVSIEYKGNYNSSTNYVTGDGVTFNGLVYYAKQATIGNDPSNASYWQIFNYIIAKDTSPVNTDVFWLDTTSNIIKHYDQTKATWVDSNSNSAKQISDGTYTYTPTDIHNKFGINGSSIFNSTTGTVINHSIGNTNYIVNVTPTSNPNGYLGEVWVIKASNSFAVYCSGSSTTDTFDYMVITF